MSNNEEKDSSFVPRKPSVPKGQGESRAWSVAFKRIMHYSRMSRHGAGVKTGAGQGRARRRVPGFNAVR